MADDGFYEQIFTLFRESQTVSAPEPALGPYQRFEKNYKDACASKNAQFTSQLAQNQWDSVDKESKDGTNSIKLEYYNLSKRDSTHYERLISQYHLIQSLSKKRPEGYILYLQEQSRENKDKGFDKETPDLQQMWNSLSENDRKLYDDKAKQNQKENIEALINDYILEYKAFIEKQKDTPQNLKFINKKEEEVDEIDQIDIIIGIKRLNGKKEYLVRFKGKTGKDAKWFPKKKLRKVRDMVKEFEDAYFKQSFQNEDSSSGFDSTPQVVKGKGSNKQAQKKMSIKEEIKESEIELQSDDNQQSQKLQLEQERIKIEGGVKTKKEVKQKKYEKKIKNKIEKEKNEKSENSEKQEQEIQLSNKKNQITKKQNLPKKSVDDQKMIFDQDIQPQNKNLRAKNQSKNLENVKKLICTESSRASRLFSKPLKQISNNKQRNQSEKVLRKTSEKRETAKVPSISKPKSTGLNNRKQSIQKVNTIKPNLRAKSKPSSKQLTTSVLQQKVNANSPKKTSLTTSQQESHSVLRSRSKSFTIPAASKNKDKIASSKSVAIKIAQAQNNEQSNQILNSKKNNSINLKTASNAKKKSVSKQQQSQNLKKKQPQKRQTIPQTKKTVADLQKNINRKTIIKKTDVKTSKAPKVVATRSKSSKLGKETIPLKVQKKINKMSLRKRK